MPREQIRRINITNTPDLLRLAEEVRQSDTRIILTDNEQDLAVVSPAQHNSQLGIVSVDARPTTWEDVEQLEGVVGSLPQPLSYKEMRRIAYEDRFGDKQQSEE